MQDCEEALLKSSLGIIILRVKEVHVKQLKRDWNKEIFLLQLHKAYALDIVKLEKFLDYIAKALQNI